MKPRTDIATAYANAGWHVFPLTPGGKTPATKHGLKDATVDVAQVARWWGKNPDYNVGVATGPSQLVVVDVDPDAGGLDSLWTLIRAGWPFPATLTQVTPSGGAHYVYKAPPWELRNTAGKLPGVPDPTPGIDVRANGGYIVVPPSATEKGEYEWQRHGPSEPAECPHWLRPEPRSTQLSTVTAVVSNGYGQAALDGECEAVRNAPNGTRNHQLNESAFKLFTLVATGALDESTVVTRLGYAARSAGLDESEIRNTIRSAADAGLRNPRSVA